MPVNLQVLYNHQMKLKFETKSARVKGVSFHPSKPWAITSLHSGEIHIWDYSMKLCVAKFEGHQGPSRGVDFHPQLPLFVSGGDDAMVKVWDYKQKRCLFTLKGHIDYIRTTFFHHELPWIISSCDDQTMRIWNYQSRACVNIIAGHSHYVMCAQFHHEKNFIVSASLDSTIRIWDFSVLRKKLTETKNLSNFIGVEIECIKVLDGHERGVNWVCFHPTHNIIASCSDDRKIKLWKYTNQVAWEHSTIPGHKNNVSCVLFDGKTDTLISNSEDKTLKIWNYETKAQLSNEKRQNDRYWMLRLSKNGNLLGAGHDAGFEIWELNKTPISPLALIGNDLLVYAEGMKTYLYDIQKNVQKEDLYQYIPKDKNNKTFISRISVNKFDSSYFMVEVDENKQKVFVIKKKENYLNFPSQSNEYHALDSCFVSKTHIAILATPNEIHLQKAAKDDSKQVLRLSNKIQIQRIFSSNNENELIFASETAVVKFDLKTSKILGSVSIQAGSNIRQVFIEKGNIALCGKNVIIITNNDLEVISTIYQKFSIKSAYWEREDLLFYTTSIHWKYALLNGQTGVLKTLDESFRLLKKVKERKFLAFVESKRMIEVDCPDYVDIQFKLAVQAKQWASVDDMVNNKLGKQKKNLVGYLVRKGLAAAAIGLADNLEEKFALAVNATNFQLAFQICGQINTLEYWKLLGEQALKQGIYEAYELASQKQKQYEKLNFLYSLQQNRPKLQKMLKLSSKMNNPVLSYNTALFLNSAQDQENILRECGLEALAELSHQAHSGELSERLKALGSRELQPLQAEGELDFSNWPHNVVEEEA